MGSSNRNLQVAVAVAVDQNFLIFGGRFGHQRRGPTLLLSENCDSTEKDWTDRSLRVWVDHQQQPRSGCTSRLRLKIAVVDGALKITNILSIKKCLQIKILYMLLINSYFVLIVQRLLHNPTASCKYWLKNLFMRGLRRDRHYSLQGTWNASNMPGKVSFSAIVNGLWRHWRAWHVNGRASVNTCVGIHSQVLSVQLDYARDSEQSVQDSYLLITCTEFWLVNIYLFLKC